MKTMNLQQKVNTTFMTDILMVVIKKQNQSISEFNPKDVKEFKLCCLQAWY